MGEAEDRRAHQRSSVAELTSLRRSTVTPLFTYQYRAKWYAGWLYIVRLGWLNTSASLLPFQMLSKAWFETYAVARAHKDVLPLALSVEE